MTLGWSHCLWRWAQPHGQCSSLDSLTLSRGAMYCTMWASMGSTEGDWAAWGGKTALQLSNPQFDEGVLGWAGRGRVGLRPGPGPERASGRALDRRPLWPVPLAFCRCNTCSTCSLKRRFFCLILASSALRLASRSGSWLGEDREMAELVTPYLRNLASHLLAQPSPFPPGSAASAC